MYAKEYSLAECYKELWYLENEIEKTKAKLSQLNDSGIIVHAYGYNTYIQECENNVKWVEFYIACHHLAEGINDNA